MKTNLLFATLIGMVLGGLSGTSAFAGFIEIKPRIDNSMFAENNNSNATGGLFVGPTAGSGGTSLRRALIEFDIASVVPAGSTIDSVTLTLHREIAGPFSGTDVLSLHPLTASWGEGTSFGQGKGGAPTLNDATWNFRNFNTVAWTNPGGDFGASSGTLTLDTGTQFTIPSQAGMVNDVQSWLDNPGSNFGWLLKYTDEVSIGTARQFYSREAADVSLQPVLAINFTAVPEPNSILLLAAGSIIAVGCRWKLRRGA